MYIFDTASYSVLLLFWSLKTKFLEAWKTNVRLSPAREKKTMDLALLAAREKKLEPKARVGGVPIPTHAHHVDSKLSQEATTCMAQPSQAPTLHECDN